VVFGLRAGLGPVVKGAGVIEPRPGLPWAYSACSADDDQPRLAGVTDEPDGCLQRKRLHGAAVGSSLR
jgi:hypothetical protein